MELRNRKKKIMLKRRKKKQSRFFGSRMPERKRVYIACSGVCCFIIFFFLYYFLFYETFLPYPPIKPYVIIESDREIRPLEKRLLELYEGQRSMEMEFRGAYTPVDWNVGLGNDLLGFMNLLLFSLFTNSTFYIPPQFGFKSKTREYFHYLRFKNPKLQHYSIFPPNDENLRKLIIESKNDCLYNVKYDDPLAYLYNKPPRWFRYTDYKHTNYQRTDEDVYPNWRRCSDDVCRDIITSNEYVFHDHTNTRDGNVKSKLRDSNFHCLREWRNGYWAQHLFKSKAKVKYVCEELRLCNGIEWRNLDYENPPDGGYQKNGLRLMGNIFNELFEFNLETFHHLDTETGRIIDDLEPIRKIKGKCDKVISVQLRTHYAGTDDIEDMITNCVADIIKDYRPQNYKYSKGGNFGLFFTTDMYPLNHEEVYDEIKRRIKQRTGVEIHPIIPFSKGGSTSQNVIYQDSDDGVLAKRRVLYDLYVQTLADVHAITEQSTFGVWGSMIKHTREDSTSTVETQDIRVFRDKRHFPDEESLTCVKGIPYLVCPRSECPFDYK